MYIATKLLLTYLTAMTPGAVDDPNICDVVSPATGTSAVCKPHREGAPVWDASVCCTDRTCFEPTAEGRCESGESRYYCELGELNPARGNVDCYFEVPDYCDVFECDSPAPGYQAPAQEGLLCCPYGICTPYKLGSGICETEDIYYCVSVANNGDGTVDCVDWDEE
ncbi:hypothetical protein ENSA5_13840 [Enhygromyxa salina]|uniref:Uncharacterized protein n=1 Tax=Enhygromyxa salina TaxID=215803 RepID=A0A2S9YEU4_9BACT|nr:hypothetical protein [Enhygromyxa salina]PRQ03629.1 hypothetical protein ENSA5_13840 [Enhygromyxa salina]